MTQINGGNQGNYICSLMSRGVWCVVQSLLILQPSATPVQLMMHQQALNLVKQKALSTGPNFHYMLKCAHFTHLLLSDTFPDTFVSAWIPLVTFQGQMCSTSSSIEMSICRLLKLFDDFQYIFQHISNL
jgi:hypothetical protein